MSVPLEHTESPAPHERYRATLSAYSPRLLRGICDHLELKVKGQSAARLLGAIDECLRDPQRRAAAVSDVPRELRPALALMPHVPSDGWSVYELRDILRYVGCDEPDKAIRVMLNLGVLALDGRGTRVENAREFDNALGGWWGDRPPLVIPHPALGQEHAAPPLPPPQRGLTEKVRGVQESDGRELFLRAAVLWQRVTESPARLTLDGGLFKRDETRLFDDPVLCSPLFGSPAPIADIGPLALELCRHMGLVASDGDADLLRARLGTVWQESWPQVQHRMWRALVAANHWRPGNGVDEFEGRHLSARQWTTLFLLAAMDPDTWVALDHLAAELDARDPDPPTGSVPPRPRPFRVVFGDEVGEPLDHELPSYNGSWLESFVLGTMYQLGAIQTAQDFSGESRVVRLSPLGRWLMGVGPQPAPPAPVEKTLFVQGNHDVVVYRQGLTPELVGQLASFCRFKSLGAALTLELTAGSVYRGLELGRTADEMIGILERHSQRPLPAGVLDSMRTWSSRRERLTLYERCLILEFESPEELDEAIERGLAGERLGDRLLLVAEKRAVPFAHLRLAGARDYRQPPTVCIDMADDGVTWRIDPARSDLLVERELARFAEPAPLAADLPWPTYRVTPRSLAAAARLGLRAPYLREWFRRRAGRELPAAVQLMLHASSRSAVAMAQLVVLRTETEAIAEGLLQHPLTGPHIHERLGAKALAVLPDRLDALRAALAQLGLSASDGSDSITAGNVRAHADELPRQA